MIGDKDGYKKNLSISNNIKASAGFGSHEGTSIMNNFVSTEDDNAEYQISNNLDQHLATEGTNKNKLSELSNLINRKDEKNTPK